MFRRLLVAALALAPAASFASEPPPPDRRTWEQVDIVPMPKRIRLTGRRLRLAGAVIVLGAKPSEQDRIGAKWINDHIVKRRGRALPVLSESNLRREAAARIFIGTRETCAAIDQAARAGRIRIGPGVPGKHGYVIAPFRRGARTDLLLAGADPIGALYACVTLAGLLDGEQDAVIIREAEVVDWPDFPTVTHGWGLYFPELKNVGNRARWAGDKLSKKLRDEYVSAMKRHIDRLLEWKISCFKARDIYYWWMLSPKFMDAFHEVADYAKARGVHSLVYALAPFVGFRKDLPNAAGRGLKGGRPRYQKFVRCWSMDAERRRYAARIGEWARATGVTDVGFHDSDTGGFYNPARWADRCEVCRKRWGDDYAAATINKFRIFYDEIKKRAPGCRLHFTLYPYNISVLTQAGAERYLIDRYGPSPTIPQTARRLRARFIDFWRRVTAGLPADVTFCIRENRPENVRAFHQLTAPHGTFIWYKVGSEQWQTFFDESPRWAPTFYSGRDDVMFTVSLETFVPLKALAVREYAWNVRAPGATGWAQLPQAERWRHAEPRGDIYEIILPHIVRNLFGRRAAPELTRALSLNMAMNHIFDHLPSTKRRVPVLTTFEKWDWQARQAEKGCEILDPLFQRFKASGDRLGMSPWAARRFVYIREVFHCCRWMARAKGYNMLARKLAKEGKLDAARAAVRAGRETIAAARADMKRLLAERPDDPIYNQRLDWRKRPPVWKKYTPDNGVDFGVPEKLLAQTEKELPALAAAGELPESARRTLAKRRVIHLAPAARAPVLDGRLDEPEWRRALPAEAFFVYPGGRTLARAQTRARFLLHDHTLYFGVTCWMPPGAAIRARTRPRDGRVIDDEQVELFLAPPGMKGGYLQFQMNAAGSVADKRVTLKRNALGGVTKTRDPVWNAKGLRVRTTRRADRWELEAAIPLAALGERRWGGRWRVNVCRDFKAASRELSSIMRPTGRDFHDTSAFLELRLHPAPAPRPEVEIDVAGCAARTRTLDDRIATVVEFGLAASASRILHDVRVRAEAYDAAGRLHTRESLARLAHLVYFWKPEKRFHIAFDQEVKAGGVRIVLESGETSCERWIRLAGWPGAGQLAPLFAPAGERRGAALRGLCSLPGEAAAPGADELLRILGRRRGAVEFWFKPLWTAAHPLETRAAWRPRHVLLHAGVLRRDYPRLFNHSAFVVYYEESNQTLYFAVRDRNYAGWTTRARVGDLNAANGWHHLACVWDAAARPDDWLRIYLDGKRVSGKTVLSKPERLGADKSVQLAKPAFAIQVGALNTGRCPACALIDDLRISRSARYTSDFAPPASPAPDQDTAALFHFDGSLAGEGATLDGRRYELRGAAGALEWR